MFSVLALLNCTTTKARSKKTKRTTTTSQAQATEIYALEAVQKKCGCEEVDRVLHRRFPFFLSPLSRLERIRQINIESAKKL